MPGTRDGGEPGDAIGPVQTPAEAGRADDPSDDRPGPLPTALSASDGLAVEQRLRAWWHGGSRRRRLALLATGLVAAATALAWGAAMLVRPSAPAAPTAQPVPWPAQAAAVRYSRLLTDRTDPTQFTVVLTVADTSAAPLNLERVEQPYRGVEATSASPLPLLILPGTPQTVWVHMTVRDCSLTPRADILPFIDVTLSNLRAIQTQSEILGSGYAGDLHAAISAACPSSPTDVGKTSPDATIPAR